MKPQSHYCYSLYIQVRCHGRYQTAARGLLLLVSAFGHSVPLCSSMPHGSHVCPPSVVALPVLPLVVFAVWAFLVSLEKAKVLTPLSFNCPPETKGVYKSLGTRITLSSGALQFVCFFWLLGTQCSWIYLFNNILCFLHCTEPSQKEHEFFWSNKQLISVYNISL